MAEQLSPGEGHNSDGSRQDIIVETIKDLVQLEGERAEISTQIRELKNKRIKGDLDMKISDFNAARRLYNLEGDDRNIFFKTLRETFNALGVGEQLNFLEAA